MRVFNNFVIVVAALAVIFSYGCTEYQRSYAVNVGYIASDLSKVKGKYDAVEEILREKADLFSPDEIEALEEFDATVDVIFSMYENMVESGRHEVDIDEVAFMWSLAADGYNKVRDIVGEKIEEFSPGKKIALKSFDNEAKVIQERMESIMKNPEGGKITEALSMVLKTASLAQKLFLLI